MVSASVGDPLGWGLVSSLVRAYAVRFGFQYVDDAENPHFAIVGQGPIVHWICSLAF